MILFIFFEYVRRRKNSKGLFGIINIIDQQKNFLMKVILIINDQIILLRKQEK